MLTTESLIIAIAVCALVGVHVLVSATERPGRSPMSYREALIELARGTDTTARALGGFAVGAVAFAGLAPVLPSIGSMLGTVFPG
jgi:hypothetical protein